MAANNMAMLIGRSGIVPEVRYLDNSRVVTKLRLAVKRPIKDKTGAEVTDWFGIEFWGKQAELAGELIKKGSLISVSGAVHIDEWTDNTGNKRSSIKISADNFQLLESKAQAGAMAAAAGEVEAPALAEKPDKPDAGAGEYEEELDEIPF